MEYILDASKNHTYTISKNVLKRLSPMGINVIKTALSSLYTEYSVGFAPLTTFPMQSAAGVKILSFFSKSVIEYLWPVCFL